jgi:hypothetical protein
MGALILPVTECRVLSVEIYWEDETIRSVRWRRPLARGPQLVFMKSP